MKVCDVMMNSDDMHPSYIINVPVVKQPAQSLRHELLEFRVIPEIGEILFEYNINYTEIKLIAKI